MIKLACLFLFPLPPLALVLLTPIPSIHVTCPIAFTLNRAWNVALTRAHSSASALWYKHSMSSTNTPMRMRRPVELLRAYTQLSLKQRVILRSWVRKEFNSEFHSRGACFRPYKVLSSLHT